MSTVARFALAALGLLLSPALAGCGEDTGVVTDPATRLDGDYVSDGAPDPPFADGSEPIRLTLRDGQISFTAGCNHFSGHATWDDGVLRTSALGGTEMGCPGARQRQDEWMVDFFGSTPSLEPDGTDLAVRSEAAEVWFVPADEVASGQPGDADDLAGTEWRLDSIGERDGDSVGMMVVPRDVLATIRFEDGRVIFSSGCNSGSGRATVSGDTISFGRLASSVMGCEGTAGEAERSVMRVLQGTVSWSISGEELRLVTSDGRHELVYHR
ncbi:MAG TPA: META domain-containing protein [Nocardioides sp.]|nr:META domain-containing protein [Nocardioides sp.]